MKNDKWQMYINLSFVITSFVIYMPADTDGFVFYSHGSKLIGTLYSPHGEGKKPTALLLHGFPGHEKNVDVAYALREAGWNAVTFHYRGCWGSEGTYALSGIVDDTIAAIDHLSGRDDVDMTRFAVVGMSLGGWGVVAAAARDDRIRAVVILNPLVDPMDCIIGEEFAQSCVPVLNGVTARELQSQWMSLTPLQDIASHLATRPTLLISGEVDELFCLEHQKILVDALPSVEWWRIPQANHIFVDHRAVLVRGIVDWLTKTFSSRNFLIFTNSVGLTLRSPIEADHPRVLSVMTDWWGGRDLTSLLPRLYFQHFTDTSFIVEKNGELVAFLIGFMSQDQPRVAYIHFVGVHPEQRKNGLAKYLYERFFALARSRGAREVQCITSAVNTGSIAFHKRMGFETIERDEKAEFRKKI